MIYVSAHREKEGYGLSMIAVDWSEKEKYLVIIRIVGLRILMQQRS